MTMPRVRGKRIRASELPTFTWNADLVAYDGPLLSLFKSEKGDDALFAWLDSDGYAHRWAIIELDRDTLANYLSQVSSLRTVFQRAKAIFVFDQVAGTRRHVVDTKWESLPDSYLPTEDSILTNEIATNEALRLAADTSGTYSIGLDGELFIEDIAAIPRLYQQLYSFHYGLAHLDRAAVRSTIAAVKRWSGGFSAVNLFSGLSNVIPSIHRPRVNSIQYASPGHIRMELLPAMAQQIYAASQRLKSTEDIDKAEALYKDIYQFFKKNKISGFESDQGSLRGPLSTAELDALRDFVRQFLQVMNWSSYTQQFTSLEIGPLAQLRALLAYYRRLRKLLVYQRDGKIELQHVSASA